MLTSIGLITAFVVIIINTFTHKKVTMYLIPFPDYDWFDSFHPKISNDCH